MKEDEEAVEIFSIHGKGGAARKTIDATSVAKSRSTTFSEFVQLKLSKTSKNVQGVQIPGTSSLGKDSKLVRQLS